MNVLIVDDNANNRMILNLMLGEYAQDNNLSFKTKEASDGQIAINMCKEEHFDLVFMDIMMPNIDGIEATRSIKEADSSIMIIAVSAIDDTEKMKLMLNSGAEDYIPKPVNGDIFTNRTANYFHIIKARKHRIKNKNHYNVFSATVYKRYTKFIIDSEESLAEFWECFLFATKEKFDDVSDVVRTVFSIAEAQLKLSGNSNIYIEESVEFQYFTLENIDVLPLKVIKLMIQKSYANLDYKVENNKLSFQLKKITTSAEVNKKIEVKSTPNISEFKKSQEVLEVFDYIDEDDMYDLEEYSSKLSSLMLIVGSGDITEEEVHEMCSYLERLSQILATYSEIYQISLALSALANDLSKNIDVFIINSNAIGPMCKAFSNDMSNWIQMSFYTGAPSVDFMNDTITVNCQTIASMLKMNDEVQDDALEDLDDIFDF